MIPLDFKNLEEKQKDAVHDFLLDIKSKAFLRTQFDYRRWQMDCALKQEFMDAGLYNQSYLNYNLNAEQAVELTGKPMEEINDYTPDQYSDLYVPLLLKFFRAYLVNMSNLNFPANGDWLNLTRSFSEYFYKTGIEKFLPFVNDAWVDIIKTENQRFSIKDKYKAVMAEVISYGNTFMGHSYNPHLHYIEPYAPGIGCAGIYPIADDWRKSNLIFYYDVNFSEILDRTDFDQSIVEELEPETTGSSASVTAGSGSTRMKDHYSNIIPFGKLRLYDFFIPSLFIRSKDSGESLIAKNIYITAAIKPHEKEGSTLDNERLYILKVTQDVSPVEHGLLFAAFSTNLPGVFYQQGPLQPFLPHQYVVNQLFSQSSRTVGLMCDPPKTAEMTNGGVLDPLETPIPDFEAGAIYENMKITPLIGAEFANALNIFLSYIQYAEKTVEEGTGISKNQTGTINQGRKTAAEIKEAYSGSQLNVVEAAGRFDEQVLRPSIVCRIVATQQILQEQVKKSVIELLEQDPSMQEDQAYDQALALNPLFNRLMNYSGIEALYQNFYKKTQKERIEDMTIFQEVQQMAQQAQAMIQYADSPIAPPPPLPEIDPSTGLPMDPVKAQQFIRDYVQGQQQDRDQKRQEAKQIEIEMKIKELTFADTQEPPEPSKKLFYQMLIAPITDSDVVVTGAMTTTSKELARENLLMLLDALRNFPQGAAMKVDYEGILMLLARANDIPLRDMLKDETQLLREEEEQKKEAMRQQQLQMQMAQNPGAQIPKIQ